ncbi:unnamed protein product [Calypogeia fissa]
MEAPKVESPGGTEDTNDEGSEQSGEVGMYKPDCERVIEKLVESLQVGAGGHLERTPKKVLNKKEVSGTEKLMKVKSEPGEQNRVSGASIREELQVYAGLNNVSRVAMDVLLKEKVMMLYAEAQATQKDSTKTTIELTGATKTNRADKAAKEMKIVGKDKVRSSSSPRIDEAKGLLELKKSSSIPSGSGVKDETEAGVRTEEKQPTEEKADTASMDVD